MPGRFSNCPSLLTLILLAVLSGCSAQDQSLRIDDYQDRLSNVLELDLPALLVPDFSHSNALFPPEIKILDQSEQASISVLDFLSLYGCELQVVLGEQNSSLGRFAAESVRLKYLLAFVKHAPACIDVLLKEGDKELAKALQRANDLKRQLIPVALWNTLLAGEEARSFWRTKVPEAYPENVGLEVVRSIRALSGLANQVLPHGDPRKADIQIGGWSSELERNLFTLATGDGGALLRAMWQLKTKLEQLNRNLNTQATAEALCFNGQSRFSKQILDNVVQQFFIQGVQAWASQLSSRYYQIMPAYHELEDSLLKSLSWRGLSVSEPEAYRLWRNARDKIMDDAFEAARQHVAQIKRLSEMCKNPNQNEAAPQ